MKALAALLKKPRDGARWVVWIRRRKNFKPGASVFVPRLWYKGDPHRLPINLFDV